MIALAPTWQHSLPDALFLAPHAPERSGYGSRPSMWCKIGCGHWAAFSGGLGCNL
ncbi:hypothetical protein [Novosphingobium resinovorum]|uniref:hypothetical protein n=1 Tax=Novosphingobium resinovorum TaxID=158500 RepID=UPI00333F5C55